MDADGCCTVLKQQHRLSFSHYEEKVEGLEGFKIKPVAFLKASLHPTKGLFNLQPQWTSINIHGHILPFNYFNAQTFILILQ